MLLAIFLFKTKIRPYSEIRFGNNLKSWLCICYLKIKGLNYFFLFLTDLVYLDKIKGNIQKYKKKIHKTRYFEKK